MKLFKACDDARMKNAILLLLLVCSPLFAADEFTLYDLLPPESHQFAITYDVTQDREGAELFFNPIRVGSIATKERVLARATGKELQFEVVSGKVAKESGLVSPKTADDAQFIRVHLPAAVPKGGETRIRILKTYTDAASYYVKDGNARFRAAARHQAQRRPAAEVVGADRVRVAGHRLDRCRRTDSHQLSQRSRRSIAGEDRRAEAAMKRALILLLALRSRGFSRRNRFIAPSRIARSRYWLLDPATHQFRISHDFTVTRAGQKSVHSFVRKGSVVSPDAKMIDLDTGADLVTHSVAGKDVNALGYYPNQVEPDSVAVQGDLAHPIAEGQSARIRVQETYTDPVGYILESGELLWKRTLGRPLNYRHAARRMDADLGEHARDHLAR